MATPQRVRITAELARTAPAQARPSGPAAPRIRLLDQHEDPPRLLASVSLAEAVVLRDQLAEAIAQGEAQVREPAAGHDPGG